MPTPEVHDLDLETVLSQAHRCRDLLTGAGAMLRSPRHELGAASAGNILCEARAELDGIVHALESMAAVRHEAERAERLHREQQAKITAGVIGAGSVR